MALHTALVSAPLAGGFVALAYGLRSVFIVGGIVSLLGGLISIRMYPRGAPSISQERDLRDLLEGL